MENIFSHSLRKTCHQRKLRQTKCLLFNFWVIQFTVIYQKKTFGTLQFGNIDVLVKNWKVNTYLVCLSFLWWQVFLREREKIFSTYSGPKRVQVWPMVYSFVVGFCYAALYRLNLAMQKSVDYVLQFCWQTCSSNKGEIESEHVHTP